MAVRPIAAAPTSSVLAGDSLVFNFHFDPAAAVRTVNDGPQQQTFAVPTSDISARVGAYYPDPGSASGLSMAISLGTGFRFFGGPASEPVFNQQFAIPALATGNLPFSVGPDGRVVLLLLSTFRQDFGGATPTLADVRDPSEAAINSFQLVVINGSNRAVGLVEGQFAGSFAAAVPEPAAWALLILGFGTAGGAMRSRRSEELKGRAVS